MSFSFSSITTNFNNYFYPTSKEPALHEAFRKSSSPQDENFQQLLKNGGNVLEKDNQGLTIIDYAVFDGKQNYLPEILTGQKLFVKPFAKPKNTQLLDKAANQILNLQNSKPVLEFQKLMHPFAEAIENKNMTSEMQAEFLTFVENNCQAEFGSSTLKFSLIHLLALQSNPELLKIAIEKHPEWLRVTDSHGNSLLHYAALNSDKTVFLELLKNKADLFSTNHNQHTPLDFLIRRIEKADPLAWDRNDVWMFLGALMPSTLIYLFENNLVTEGTTLDLLLISSSIISYLSMYGYLKTVLERFQSTPAKALMTLLYLGISWVPVISLPLKAYTLYSFATRAFETIKASWQHAYHRPLTGLAVSTMRTVQALDCTQDFYNQSKIANWFYENWNNIAGATKCSFKVAKEFDSFEKNCGAAPEIILANPKFSYINSKNNGNELPSIVNPKFKDYVDCRLNRLAEICEDELQNNPAAKDFYENDFTPFAQTLTGDCIEASIKGGEGGFASCAIAQFNEYFSKYFNFSSTLATTQEALEKAREIIGVSSSATTKEIKSTCKKLYLSTHPDHNSTAGAAEHFHRVSEACSTLLKKA